MNPTQLVDGVKSGKVLVVAEWRSGEATEIKGISNKTRQPYVFKRVEHNLEIGGKPMAISESLPDDANVATYKMPYKKGDQVVVDLALEDQGKGIWRVTGALSPYEQAKA